LLSALGATVFGSAGSAFMMLTGGIEAADGKSYLSDTGWPDGGSVLAPGTAGSAATGTCLSGSLLHAAA
jgi:hypothetical protein